MEEGFLYEKIGGGAGIKAKRRPRSQTRKHNEALVGKFTCQQRLKLWMPGRQSRTDNCEAIGGGAGRRLETFQFVVEKHIYRR
jgi:hypothetical protein